MMTGSLAVKDEENVSETGSSWVGHDPSVSSTEIVSMKTCQEYTKIIFLYWFHSHRLVIVNGIMMDVFKEIK